MTRDDIIRLAREAGFLVNQPSPELVECMEHFANLVVADFLERTGQYVTNDASREAAIAEAVAKERKARIAAQAELQHVQQVTQQAGVLATKVAYARGVEAGAAAEREACADICDDLHWNWRIGDTSGPKECAEAIRARGKKGGV